MKKLLCMMLGLAVGAFAYGGDGGDFGYTANEPGTGTLTYAPVTDDETAITEFGDEETSDSIYGTGRVGEAYTEIGSIIKDGNNKNYLKVKSSLTAGGGYAVSGSIDFSKNVCVDTLVRFTAGVDAEEGEYPTLNGGKIAVWLKQVDADADATPAITGETNLYVTAGFYNGSAYVEKAFKVANVAVAPGTWHRVTVRTLDNVLSTEDNLTGYLVYVDGNLVSCGEDYDIGVDDEDLTAAAGKYVDAKQLFISAAGIAPTALTAITFAGNGDIDDTSITWGDAVPAYAVAAVETQITTDNAALTNVCYKVGADGAWVNAALPVQLELEADTEIFFDKTNFKFADSETTGYAVKDEDAWTGSKGWDLMSGAWKFSGEEDSYIEIAIQATDFAVTLSGVGGFATADAALAYLETPEGKLYQGTVKFLTAATGTGYSFPANTTIVIANGGVWTITNGSSRNAITWTLGFEAEKQVTINGKVTLGGLIKGDGRVKTLVTVNGACAIDQNGLTVGDNSEGAGAAFVVGETGTLDTAAGLITLGLNGEVTTVAQQTIADVFAPVTGYHVVEAGTGPYTYTLAEDAKTGFMIMIAGEPAYFQTIAEVEAGIRAALADGKTVGNVITAVSDVTDKGLTFPAESTLTITATTDAQTVWTIAVPTGKTLGVATGFVVEAEKAIVINGDVNFAGTVTLTAGGRWPAYVTVGTQATDVFDASDDDWKVVESGTYTYTVTAKQYVVQVAAGGETFKYEADEIAAALAKVQELEKVGEVTVTALAEITVPGPDSQTITLAKDGTITISATGWAFTGAVSGTVTLAPGKTLSVAEGSAITVSTIAGYKVVKATEGGITTYTVKTPFSGGTGDEATPFLIANVDNLKELQTDVAEGVNYAGKFFLQTQDIDMTEAGAWTGIGVYKNAGPGTHPDYYFGGVYDGNNFAIENLTLAADRTYGALFNMVDGATIENLTVNVAGFSTPTSAEYGLAAVVGYAINATVISNVTATGTIGSSDVPMNHTTGGIAVDFAGTDSKMIDCSSSVNIFCTKDKMGGLVGFNGTDGKAAADAGTEYIRCTYTGTITVMGNATTGGGKTGVGQLCGWSKTRLDITDCVCGGTIVDNTDGSAIIGAMAGAIGNASYDHVSTIDGSTVPADMKAIGKVGTKMTVEGDYGIIVGETAVLTTPAVGKTFKVLIDGQSAAITLAENESISFVTNLCEAAFDVTTTDTGCEVTETADATGVTFTCAKQQIALNLTVDAASIASVTVNEATPAATYAYGTQLTIAAVAQEGYENPQYVIGTTTNALPYTFTITETTALEIIATKKSGGWDPAEDPTTPASDKGITGKLADAPFNKLSTWAQTYKVPFAAGSMDAYADAYLLDCDPDDVATEAAKFKIVSITKDGDAWLVKVTGEKGQAVEYGNGYVNIKSVKDKFAGAGDNADFFQAELTVQPVVKGE